MKNSNAIDGWKRIIQGIPVIFSKEELVKERALHIYRSGNGPVNNEDVDAVLKELNDKIGGHWGAGISNDEITWIEEIV